MKSLLVSFILVSMIILPCCKGRSTPEINIIFLHHSTGEIIWQGKQTSKFLKLINSAGRRLNIGSDFGAQLPKLLKEYNRTNNKNYKIREMNFPKATPYGWKNYPYDYYNLWIKNAGEKPFMEEPTLEMLTRDYNVIIFKHCFPVCNIQPDQDIPDINSETKTLPNYKLQYTALRDKLHEFPETKFIVFTGAAQVKKNITEEEALRARDFFTWVVNEWDIPGDNIYIWDFYNLETEGELYLLDKYAVSGTDSHPNSEFAETVTHLLLNRITDIVENKGANTQNSGRNN